MSIHNVCFHAEIKNWKKHLIKSYAFNLGLKDDKFVIFFHFYFFKENRFWLYMRNTTFDQALHYFPRSFSSLLTNQYVADKQETPWADSVDEQVNRDFYCLYMQ